MAFKPTQRAYTLRLRGMRRDDGTEDQTWRDALWRTHEAVNKGAGVFGDWLLTLRGGLDHGLADQKVKLKDGSSRKPTREEVRARRIVLALSWLSVESGTHDRHRRFIVTDPVAAFKEILKQRGLKATEIAEWTADCEDSLKAAIREDAVWVNRSAAFDAAAKRISELTRAEAWDFLSPFFVDAAAYLAPDKSAETEESAGESEKAKDLSQKAGQWLSSRFGEGPGADFSALRRAYARIADAARAAHGGRSGASVLASLARTVTGKESDDPLAALLDSTSAPGHKSATRNRMKKLAGMKEVGRDDLAELAELAEADAEAAKDKTGVKGHRPYADAVLADVERACAFTYIQQDGPARHWEFAVMLDHAARRVSVAHSWQKLAEARRQQFAKDARQRAPRDVEEWLDRFLEERARLTGAAGPMQIRRRAVDGWDEVVKAWSAKSCKTPEDRIAKARELQDELEKFGDIWLFEALADDDAKVVWFRDGEPDPQPLLDYVYSHDAEAKMRRFKVPAYRHPDPLLHPVFCDYGCSRWPISFAVHEAAQAFRKADKAVADCEAAHAQATGEDAKMKTRVRLLKAKKARDAARAAFRESLADRGLSLGTWNGKAVAPAPLLWQSKRLAADLMLEQSPDGTSVSRADRISRAAAGTGGDAAVLVLNVFEEKDWNGRLQAPRAQLDRLGRRVQKHGWDAQARKMLARLNWFITFSARLMPQTEGPWPKFARAHRLRENPVYWPHADENKKRGGHAKLVLCRLPGLRVLSVDLGHRYAAACAVWETLTEEAMNKVCAAAERSSPQPGSLAIHLLGRRNGRKVKTIYRRTGPDMWARLDRQFTIRLQGEDAPCRMASAQELKAVAGFEAALGRTRTADDSLPHDVVSLMSEAVRSARLGLRRHADRARIAFNLTTDRRPLPGGRWEALTPETRPEFIQDTLVLWQSLFRNPNWHDDWAREMWNEHVRAALPAAPAEGASRAELKADDKKVREVLTDCATRLAANPSLRKKLHILWARRWRDDDKQWVKHLRWLRLWLLPRGRAKSDGSIRHVGGLSLDRLSNIRELWQAMKAHKTRPEPEDVRKNVPEKGDSRLENYGKRVLDALEHMRENRVKQLASRIIEAALGIGSEDRRHWQAGKRPRQTIADPRFAQCHAIVTEALDRYLPEQTRTRRENRALMRWSAAKVLKYLKEGCDLNGLHLRQVLPNYTSLQDSRTGAPGIRCTDMPVPDFLKRYERLAKNAKGEEKEYLRALNEKWDGCRDRSKRVRIPVRGGELFVSADPNSPAASGLQADLNAAANIGLRALLDPDWPGKWWWVPCDGNSGKPDPEKTKGQRAFRLDQQLLQPGKDEDAEKAKGRKEKPPINAWRDVSAAPVEGEWQAYSEYWNRVKARVVANLRKQAGL